MSIKTLEKKNVDKNTILKEYGKQISSHEFWEYLSLISYSFLYVGNDRYIIKNENGQSTNLQLYSTEDPRIENGDSSDSHLHFPIKGCEIKLMGNDTLCISATKDAFIMFHNSDNIKKEEVI